MSLKYDWRHMRAHIANFVRRQPSQKAAAKTLKISPSYLGDVLNGRREISEKLAAKFGFERQIIFYCKDNPTLLKADV